MPKRKNIVAVMKEEIAREIAKSGKTRYRIAIDAGIKPDVLGRFVSGERDLRLATAAKVCEALNLELRKRNS